MRLALKEWSAVVAALAQGRQILLLRKGGIIESRHGFELEHSDFLLFPTFSHQHETFVRPEWRHLLDQAAPAGRIAIRYLARASRIFPAPDDPAVLEAAGGYHIWTPQFLRQRYQYRPDLPLWVVVIRLFSLQKPQDTPDRPAYAGCRSWVHLEEQIDIDGAVPVLPDDDFGERQEALFAALATAGRGC